MFRFTRTVTLKQMASTHEALKFAATMVEHLRKEYGMNTQVGTELFGEPKLHWFTDLETLDQLTQRQSKMLQDKTYWSLIDSAKHLWIDGSVRDRMVKLL